MPAKKTEVKQRRAGQTAADPDRDQCKEGQLRDA
jgi:hypothetical protein